MYGQFRKRDPLEGRVIRYSLKNLVVRKRPKTPPIILEFFVIPKKYADKSIFPRQSSKKMWFLRPLEGRKVVARAGEETGKKPKRPDKKLAVTNCSLLRSE
jgi:hypothetical protein